MKHKHTVQYSTNMRCTSSLFLIPLSLPSSLCVAARKPAIIRVRTRAHDVHDHPEKPQVPKSLNP